MDIRGTEGADVLNGGAGDDVIYGFGGNDTLKGGAGDDALAGNDGADILRGGDGDDYLQGGAGNDTIDGGAGSDWAGYDDATAGVKVDLSITVAQNTGGSGTDKLTGIENLHGSAFNDTLIGDAKDNVIIGDAGADTISGGKGGDTLWGSAGADALDGGDGDDWLVGGAGDDVIKGGAGGDWASYEDATAGVKVDLTKTAAQDTGGAGKDTLSGVENLWGSAFADTLTGDAGSNYLFGAAGNDTLTGGAGDDFFAGGVGVNVLDGGDGFDTIDYAMSDVGVEVDLSRNTATSRTDATIKDTLSSIELVTGSTHDDLIVGNMAENYLFGDAGNDVLWAVGGHDTLDGGDGDDVLYGSNLGEGDLLLGGAGDDKIIVCAGEAGKVSATVDGGVGRDTLQFNTSLDVTFDLRNTGDQLAATNTHVTAQNFENLTGGDGADRLTGDAKDNVIEGRGGDDILDGGAGVDIASYASALGAVRVDLSKAGVAQYTRGAGTDTLSNFEGLKGSKYSDVLIGDAKDNTLEGGAGNDILDGGAGVDTAIYKGASKDYTWVRNANGTWTVAGTEGIDTLLNIEKLKFNDKTVTLPSSDTTVTVEDLLKPKTILSSPGHNLRDAVLSSDGRTVYVSDADGYVSAVDATTGAVRGHWKVGAQLGGMDVSNDGRYLVATEGVIENPTGGQSQFTATIKVHVLDLSSGVVKDYTTTATGNDRAFADAAFTYNGKIALSQSGNGNATGLAPVTTLDPETGAFTRGQHLYYAETVLSPSNDHLAIYVSGTTDVGLLTPQGEVIHQPFLEGASSGSGMQAVSLGGQFVAEAASDIRVYDSQLKYIANLSTAHPEISSVYGMDFSPDGKHLFVVDAGTDRVFEFSASDWALENAFSLGVDIDPALTPDYFGQMYGNRVSVSDDGRMIIFSAYGLVSVDLKALNPEVGGAGADVIVRGLGNDVLNGLGGDDAIYGGGGNDMLNGGEGADTLVGGKGNDTLTGGAGADVFKFLAGEGQFDTRLHNFDTITDFGAGDKLAFTSAPTVVKEGDIMRMTAHVGADGLIDMAEALYIDAYNTQIQNGVLGQRYLVVDVGADTYVLADTDPRHGGYDTVVLLKGVTSSLVTADVFMAA